MSKAIAPCAPPAVCRPQSTPAIGTPSASAWTPWATLGALRRWLTEGRRRRAAIRELQRVSHDQLRDIGIAPGEIEEVVDTLLARGRADHRPYDGVAPLPHGRGERNQFR